MMAIRSMQFLLLLLVWIGAPAALSAAPASCVEATCQLCPVVGDAVERALGEPVYCIA